MHERLEALGFPVGTRVVMIVSDPYEVVKSGQTGTVRSYTSAWEDDDGCNIGVDWDEGGDDYHNCMGACRRKHGRYVPHTSIRPEGYDLDLGEFDTSEFTIGVLFDTT